MFDNLLKNWEDCPLQIHLISNKKTYNHKKIINADYYFQILIIGGRLI